MEIGADFMTSGPDKNGNRQGFCNLMSSGACHIRTSQYIYHKVEENDLGLLKCKFQTGKLFVKLSVCIISLENLRVRCILNITTSHFSLHGLFTSQCSSHYNNIRAGCFLCPRFGCVGVRDLEGIVQEKKVQTFN